MYKKSVLQVQSCFIVNEARPTEFFGRFHRRHRLALKKNININSRASLVDLAAIYLMLHKSLFMNSPVKILTKRGEGRGYCCSVTKNVIKQCLRNLLHKILSSVEHKKHQSTFSPEQLN